MKRSLLVIAAACLIVAGCGGGGSSTNTSTTGTPGTVVGRVLNVETGGPLSPAATVQVDSNTTTTDASDGSFTVSANAGAKTVLVDTHALFGVWSFAIPAVNGTTDAGDLWVGPQKVTLTGHVLSSTDSQPVAGATVSFGGVTGITNAQGVFSLPNVAYSSTTQTAFWGIQGSAVATGFFASTFSAAPAVANNGVVTVSDVLLTPLSDTTPPNNPANIVGRVTPSSKASGTMVTLAVTGGNVVRIFNVDSTGDYSFWVPDGSYTVTYANGTATAPAQSVTLTSTDQVVHVPDVVLNG